MHLKRRLQKDLVCQIEEKGYIQKATIGDHKVYLTYR